MEKLSVVVITFNEESHIARCIDSIRKIADEIVVLDSYSTDQTVTIARQRGAIVFQQSFAGYIEQKNEALRLASYRLVLSLDADETVDERLLASIEQVKEGTPLQAYSMNRCTNYCGRFIRHGSWYPDRKLRLFDKTTAAWAGINPHDKVVCIVPQRVVHLQGDILHYSYRSLEEHVTQNNRFSTISAETYLAQGKKGSWFNMVVNPVWAFIHSYLIRRGFLDGFYGWVIAINVAHLTFMKYYKLYAFQKGIRVRAA